jgi:hypothetical protein
MTYQPYMLWLFGVLGVVLHNLFKLNALKKANPEGDVNYKKYFKLEWISILISFIVVALCVWTSREIEKLQAVSNYLGLAFIAIGYMAQSIFITLMGKAEKVVNTQANDGK